MPRGYHFCELKMAKLELKGSRKNKFVVFGESSSLLARRVCAVNLPGFRANATTPAGTRAGENCEVILSRALSCKS